MFSCVFLYFSVAYKDHINQSAEYLNLGRFLRRMQLKYNQYIHFLYSLKQK